MLRNGLAIPESVVLSAISSKRPLLLLKILWVPPVTVKVSRENDETFASSSALKRELRYGAPTDYYELVVHSDDSNSTSDDGASSTDECDAVDFSENDGVEDSYEEMRKHTTGYRFVDLEILQELFLETAVCKYCREGSLHKREVKVEGVASLTEVECQSCEAKTSKTLAKCCARFWDINRIIVFAMRWIGCGREALVKICGALNMPPVLS